MAALIINLNHEVILLLGRQMIPVRHDFDEDLRHSQSQASGSVNIGQVLALGILDPTVLIGNEEVVLRHGCEEY
jgi:hypothetical protein